MVSAPPLTNHHTTSSRSPFSLEEKVVIQFGGTGHLGRALLAGLLEAGATTVVASRSQKSVSVATNPAHLPRLNIEEVDICSEPSLHALRDRVLARHKRVDGVVFNAVSRPMLRFGDDLSMWQKSMDVNATGLFATARVFGDVMAARRSGSMVNIASIQGMVGTNPWLYEGTSMTSPPDYFFHKGGLLNLTRYLASHYGSSGVRVNAISPGGILNIAKPLPPEFLARYNSMTMLGRQAYPEEVCGGVVFLLSEASRYVTGVNLPVDGGYTAK